MPLGPPKIELRELCQLVDRALGDLGARRSRTALSFLTGRIATQHHWIRLFDHMLTGTLEERRKVVFNQTKATVRDLSYELSERGADPAFGFIVLEAVDGREIEEGRRGDYGVKIEWAGLMPATWPNVVTEPEVSDKVAEEAGREIQRADPEKFADARQILIASPAAVQVELEKQRAQQQASRKNLRKLQRQVGP